MSGRPIWPPPSADGLQKHTRMVYMCADIGIDARCGNSEYSAGFDGSVARITLRGVVFAVADGQDGCAAGGLPGSSLIGGAGRGVLGC